MNRAWRSRSRDTRDPARPPECGCPRGSCSPPAPPVPGIPPCRSRCFWRTRWRSCLPCRSLCRLSPESTAFDDLLELFALLSGRLLCVPLLPLLEEAAAVLANARNQILDEAELGLESRESILALDREERRQLHGLRLLEC